MVLSPSQRALMTTIQSGKRAIADSTHNLHTPAQLNGDINNEKWKDSQLNSSKQNVVSQVSAMNAATAQMVIIVTISCILELFFNLDLTMK